MINSVSGTLKNYEKIENCYVALVECPSGITYEIKTTANSFKQPHKIGSEIVFKTHLVLKENLIELFGFVLEEEKICFKQLISVSGVGTSFALSILSELTFNELISCISSGNSIALTNCKGIGTKTAKRIILELKDKINKSLINSNNDSEQNLIFNSNKQEAIEALISLGYFKNEAAKAVENLNSKSSVEQMIKQALLNLSWKRRC